VPSGAGVVVVMGALLHEGVCLLVVLPLLPVTNSNRGNRGNAVRSRFGLRGLGDLAGDGEGGRAEVAGGGSPGGQAPGHSGGFGDDDHNALAGR